MRFVISSISIFLLLHTATTSEDDTAVAKTDMTTTTKKFGPSLENRDDPNQWKKFYIGRIFDFYGVDITNGEEMGETILSKLMLDIGLLVTHELVAGDDGHGHGGGGHDDDDDHDEHEEEDHGDDEEDDHDHDHGDEEDGSAKNPDNHRKRREVIGGNQHDHEVPINVDKEITDIISNVPHKHSINGTLCQTADILLSEYNLHDDVDSTSGIGAYEFELLCPAFIDSIIQRDCIKDIHREESEPPSGGSVWGWGILAITIISALSFLGAALIPIIAADYFDTILSVLVASAVGALVGDALLHLLPHSQSKHDHSKEGVYSNLTALGGIYLLFVIESIMKIVRAHKDRNKHHHSLELNASVKSTAKLENQFNENGDVEDKFIEIDSKVEPNHNEEHGHGHGHSHDHGDMKEKTIASVAWMVIAGDGMHNFSDGVAIGAAFSRSLVGGLSTSVAVFCHELPHELGDFAMLLKAGMSVKQALFYNAVAAATSYLGMIIGILIGKYATHVTPWIFALTAGMFIYVALADMLPEITAAHGGATLRQMLVRFFGQNFGILLGITIMLLIALFEENIDFS